MAEEKNKAKKRRIKPASQTIRQKTEKTSAKTDKPKKSKKFIRVFLAPFKFVLKLLGKIIRPFRFLLRPFKTKPFRFIGRVLKKIFLIEYFKNSWKELRQVTWPDRKKTTQLTIAVFLFATFFALLIGVVDYGLDKIFRKVFLNG